MRRIVGLAFCCLFLLAVAAAQAQAGEPGMAVVFLLDNSGSMKNNDPQGLRFTALKMFVDQLGSKDKVGLVSFGTGSKVLVPVSGLEIYEQRELIKSEQAADSNEWTDLKAGLDRAYAELERIQGEARGLVILLSDGEPEPGPGHASAPAREKYFNELWERVQDFAVRGWSVYSIGLTSKADTPTLQQISQQTGGMTFKATGSGALPGIFQEILLELHDSQELAEFSSLLLPEQWSLPQAVEVNASSRMAVFRGFNESGQRIELRVRDPVGNYLGQGSPAVNFVQGANYCILSVDKPEPGTWLVQARGVGSGRINADGQSRYGVQVLQPMLNSFQPVLSPVGLSLRVTADGLPVSDADLRVSLEYKGQEVALIPGGKLQPAGIYNGEIGQLLAEPGRYDFRLRLRDKTGSLLLAKKLSFYAKDQPYVQGFLPEQAWAGEASLLKARVMLRSGPWHGTGMEVYAGVSSPTGYKEVALNDSGREGDEVAGDGIFSAPFKPEETGEYRLRFYLAGEYGGKKFFFDSGAYQLAVRPRPRVMLKVPEQFSVGRDGFFSFEAESLADREVQLTLEGSLGESRIPRQTFILEPRSKRLVSLNIPWENPGKALEGQLRAGGKDLQVEPALISLRVYLRTPLEDFWFRHKFSLSLGAVMVLLTALGVGGGQGLNRYFRRRLTIKGILVVGGQTAAPRKLVFLNSFNKPRLTLGWDRDVDIILDPPRGAGGQKGGLMIAAELDGSLPGFVQGWASLLGRCKPVFILLCQTGSSFRLRVKGGKRAVTSSKAVLHDGDEIYYCGYWLVFRKHG